MANDWQMPRADTRCAQCAREFAAGEAFVAQLLDVPAGYQRRDLCLTCPAPGAEVPVATWKARRPLPQPRKTPAFDRATIYRVFLQLEEADTPAQQQFRFLLALLLWRKRMLRLERSATAGDRELWEFTAQDNTTHRVARPELDEAELERLSGQLEALLSSAAVIPDDVAEAGSGGPPHE